MGIFDDIKAKGAAYRLTEEALYAEALREIESGQRRDGIWAKAMAESDMDQGKAGAKYIKLRVRSLKDEVTLFVAAMDKAANQRLAAATQSQEATPKFESKNPLGSVGQFVKGFNDGFKNGGKEESTHAKAENKPLDRIAWVIVIVIAGVGLALKVLISI
jgi:hypothetical protein